MSYEIVNLKELENAAEKFGLSPNLETRFTPGLSYQRLAPSFRIPFGHKHKQQEEVYVVVGGSGRVKLDDDVVELKQWDAVRVPKETMRNFEAGPDGAEIVVFGAPRTEPGDAEVTHRWWPD